MRALIVAVCLVLTGCATTVDVGRISPGETETGIPYYLPKQYLMLTLRDGQFQTEVHEEYDAATGKLKKKTTKRVWVAFSKPRWVSEFVELPDLREKYGIEIEPGSGSSTIEIKLEDGWKLEGLNVEADNQLDELITSVGEAVPSIAGAISGLRTDGGAAPILLFELQLEGDRLILRRVDMSALAI